MTKIRVPATTANLGPGFDTLGLALNLFQEITIEPLDSGRKEVKWSGEPLLADEDNLVIVALEKALHLKNQAHLGYALTMQHTDIPISRGLGSSAAAIVAGIYAANVLMDGILTQQEIIDLATSMEGHPDNVAPAILGNLILATQQDGTTHYVKIDFPDDLRLLTLIPDYKLSTEMARRALPEQYPRSACVYNLSRLGFLLHALINHDYTHLPLALSDVIHEPYRYPLVEDSEPVKNALTHINTYGYFISGAGPTIIALIHRGESLDTLVKHLNTEAFKHHWTATVLDVNQSGAVYEILK